MKRKILLTALLIGLSFTYTVPAYAMTQAEIEAYFRNELGDDFDNYRSTGGAHPERSLVGESAVADTVNSNQEVPVQTPVEVEVHNHEYTSKITKDATCTEVGVETFTCDCGDSYTESIEMIEHDYSKEAVVKEVTCSEVGEKKITCSMCEDFITEEIPATGHKEGNFEVVISPTCEENGLEELRCSVCDEVLESKEIPATGHIEGEWEIEKEGTLFHEGSKIQRCTTCGEILFTEIIPINASLSLGLGISFSVAIFAICVYVFVRKK